MLARLSRSSARCRTRHGRWYLTRVLPYRSADDRIAGVVITFVDITAAQAEPRTSFRSSSRTLEERVNERTRQVRKLTSSLVRAEQRERRRLSETLHDELQQVLYGVPPEAAARAARSTPAGGRSRPRSTSSRPSGCSVDSTRVTRQLSVDLNPPILKHEGVRAILNWLRGQMHDLHGLDVRIRAEGEIRVEDSDVRVLMFQIFRELLFNVAQHSGASVAHVTLKEIDGELVIGFADDGRGFDLKSVYEDGHPRATIGLRQVEERLGLLGGTDGHRLGPGEGTTITLHMPRSARIGD